MWQLGRELLDPLVDDAVELGLRNHAIHETPLACLSGRDLLTEEHDLARAAISDHELEPLRRAACRNRAVLESDVANEGGVDHHREVAGHLQLVASSDRDAVDTRDRRLADLSQSVVRVLEGPEPLPVLARPT